MNLSYQQCKIEVVDCVKYLGIHLDNKLQFKQIYQNYKEFKTKQFVYLQERLGKITLLLSMRNLIFCPWIN